MPRGNRDRKTAGIFDRVRRMRPAQLRTIADRRMDDAVYLSKSHKNAHANGAMYLGGFVLECLLKSALLQKHPWLQNASGSQDQWNAEKKRLYGLCYRSHDLYEILESLPELMDRLARTEPTGRLLANTKELCGEWSIYARYSTLAATMPEAVVFLDKIKELKPWLR